MSDKEKSISQLMDMMKQDSDEFFGKTADLVVGQSGRHYYTEPEDYEDAEGRQCRLDSEREFAEDEAMLAPKRVNFPDQGHKVSGGFKESTGEITVEVKPQTEWNEKS